MLYPLKFKPVFKDKIWGGDRIRKTLGLDFSPLPNCGEAWALSGVEGNQTPVINGFLAGNDLNEVLEIYMDELVGERVYEENPGEFPLLVKFIDANDWLSIQVHPDDDLALRRGLGRGKTEMWHILDADPGAELITGFNRPLDQQKWKDVMRRNIYREVLQTETVSRGDTFFIPAGRVHALGPGILLAEIQQTSDTTYRIYDWDRVDDTGKPRDLHSDLALEAIHFDPGSESRIPQKPLLNRITPLVQSKYFTTNAIRFDRPLLRDYSDLDSFVICMVTRGNARIDCDGHAETLRTGELVLVPAVSEGMSLIPDEVSEMLEIYIA